MSEPFSRVLYPFEIARRPSIEPEVWRAILARWSSNPVPGEVLNGAGVETRSEQPRLSRG